jgi:hypothetical protein
MVFTGSLLLSSCGALDGGVFLSSLAMTQREAKRMRNCKTISPLAMEKGASAAQILECLDRNEFDA